MAKIKQSKLNEIKGYNEYKKRKEEECRRIGEEYPHTALHKGIDEYCA